MHNDSLQLVNGIHPDEYNLVYLKKEDRYQYYRHVFTKYNKETGNYDEMSHWAVPIKIYLDKNIDQDVKDDFIRFVKFLPRIERLDITFVNQKKESNYFIHATNMKIDPFEMDFYKGITYSLLTDSSKKFYSGQLTFNTGQLKDTETLKTRLKQFFFSSLGAFCILPELDKTSILSEKYQPVRVISKSDSILLQSHYGMYNQNPIGYRELKKLFEQIQNTTFTNATGNFTLKTRQ